MKRYCFQLDDDSDTGHGWRKNLDSCTFSFSPRSEELIVREDGYFNRHVNCSYAWISECDAEGKRIDNDNIRTWDILQHDFRFKGHDDMECHFEFKMTPSQVREHLLKLGMIEVTNG